MAPKDVVSEGVMTSALAALVRADPPRRFDILARLLALCSALTKNAEAASTLRTMLSHFYEVQKREDETGDLVQMSEYLLRAAHVEIPSKKRGRDEIGGDSEKKSSRKKSNVDTEF
jgi:hypothetical protein